MKLRIVASTLLAATAAGCATRAPPAPPALAPLGVGMADNRVVTLTRAGKTAYYAPALESAEGVHSARVVPLRTDGGDQAALVRLLVDMRAGDGDMHETTLLLQMPDTPGGPPRTLWRAQTAYGYTPMSGSGGQNVDSYLWLVDLDGDGRFELVQYETDASYVAESSDLRQFHRKQVFRAGSDGVFRDEPALLPRVPLHPPVAAPEEGSPELEPFRAALAASKVYPGGRPHLSGAADERCGYGADVLVPLMALYEGRPGDRVVAVVKVVPGPPRIIGWRPAEPR